MSFKTILVHADLSVHAPSRIRLAASLARDEGAHLIGAAMTGISRFVSNQGRDAVRQIARHLADTLARHARQALEQFNAIAAEAGPPSHEARLVGDDPEGGLVSLSRFADLVVMSQTDPDNLVAGAVRDLPEFVMLSVARPVLLVPYAGAFSQLGGPALVAWDGSIEASRALAAAMPLLRRAPAVTVAQFQTAEPCELPSQAPYLLGWLERHGIRAQVQEQRTGIHDGDALLSLAADLQAGLLVMGGYGHTRFRELMLGGVTKTVLEQMTCPVLMHH